MALGVGTTLLLLSCITINITIMAKQTTRKTVIKRVSTSPYNYTPSKGITIEGESMTVQDDSMTLRQMVERHLQGVIEPSEYKQGMYDEEGETEDNFDRDVEHRSQATELEAMEYAKEHGMSLEEVQEEIEMHNEYNRLEGEIEQKEDEPQSIEKTSEEE